MFIHFARGFRNVSELASQSIGDRKPFLSDSQWNLSRDPFPSPPKSQKLGSLALAGELAKETKLAKVNTIEAFVDQQVFGPTPVKLVDDKAAYAGWLETLLPKEALNKSPLTASLDHIICFPSFRGSCIQLTVGRSPCLASGFSLMRR